MSVESEFLAQTTDPNPTVDDLIAALTELSNAGRGKWPALMLVTESEGGRFRAAWRAIKPRANYDYQGNFVELAPLTRSEK